MANKAARHLHGSRSAHQSVPLLQAKRSITYCLLLLSSYKMTIAFHNSFARVELNTENLGATLARETNS